MADLPNPPFSMGDDMKKKFGYSTKNPITMGRPTLPVINKKFNPRTGKHEYVPHGYVKPSSTPIPSNPMPNIWMRILKRLKP